WLRIDQHRRVSQRADATELVSSIRPHARQQAWRREPRAAHTGHRLDGVRPAQLPFPADGDRTVLRWRGGVHEQSSTGLSIFHERGRREFACLEELPEPDADESE